jgi:hypothetical protein
MKNKVNYQLLSGGQLHAYATNLIALYTPEKTTEPLLQRLIAKATTTAADFLKGFEYDAKDPLTVETADTDLLRDKYWNGFKNYIKSYASHPDKAKATAATKIEAVIKRYGWSANRFSYDEESTAIVGLLSELGEKFAAEVALLEVQTMWLTPLAQTQKAFESLITRRVQNGAVEMPSQRQYRKPLIEALNRLIRTTETLADDSQDAPLLQLLEEIDELNERTMQAHKAEATRNKNNQTKQGTNGSAPEAQA